MPCLRCRMILACLWTYWPQVDGSSGAVPYTDSYTRAEQIWHRPCRAVSQLRLHLVHTTRSHSPSLATSAM